MTFYTIHGRIIACSLYKTSIVDESTVKYMYGPRKSYNLNSKNSATKIQSCQITMVQKFPDKPKTVNEHAILHSILPLNGR